jgi:hypothetical protein
MPATSGSEIIPSGVLTWYARRNRLWVSGDTQHTKGTREEAMNAVSEKRKRRVVFLTDTQTRKVDAYAGIEGRDRCDVVGEALDEYFAKRGVRFPLPRHAHPAE